MGAIAAALPGQDKDKEREKNKRQMELQLFDNVAQWSRSCHVDGIKLVEKKTGKVYIFKLSPTSKPLT